MHQEYSTLECSRSEVGRIRIRKPLPKGKERIARDGHAREGGDERRLERTTIRVGFQTVECIFCTNFHILRVN